MSFLNKLIAKKVNGVIKNSTKMDIVIDSLIDKFKDQCPPKAELLLIVSQKNQIQGGLEQIVSAFEPVNTAAETTETIVNTVSSAVRVIKAIPIPTSYPPGVGIPINVITLLADSLDMLGDLLKGAKVSLKIVPLATSQITSAATNIIRKLQQLDILFDGCIQDLIIDEGLTPSQIQDLALEINNVAATSGNFDNIGLNSSTEENLLNSLSPNSPNQYLYKGFIFEIQYEVGNEFSFPSRRIRVENINLNDKNVYKGVVLYNLEGGRYSFSSSVQVLINEARFRIDNLNYSFYWKQWVENQVVIEEDLTPSSQFQSSLTPQPSTSSTGSNFPQTIILTQQPWSNFNNLIDGIELAFQPAKFAPNPYKQIPYSLDIGRAIQQYTYNPPQSGSMRLKAEIKVPDTQLTFTLDTGEFTPKIAYGIQSPDWGVYNTDLDSIPYARGYAKIKINAASGSIYQDVKFLEGTKEVISYTFTYPEIGTYYVQVDLEDPNSYPILPSIPIRANTSSSLIVTYNNQ